MDRETNRKGTKLMGQFLGWASYDLPHYCKYCRDFYDEEESHEHEDCDTDTDNADDGLREESSSRSSEGN